MQVESFHAESIWHAASAITQEVENHLGFGMADEGAAP
jgi:hypothetical protein